MSNENTSPNYKSSAVITVCNDQPVRKPLARKAADALRLSRRRSVLEFFNLGKNPGPDDKLQQEWFDTMVMHSTEDQPEAIATPRLSSDCRGPRSPAHRIIGLMGSYRNKRYHRTGFNEISPEKSKSPTWSPATLRTRYEDGSVTISMPVHSSPVHHSSPIPIPEHSSQSPFVSLPDTFNTSDGDANFLSRQFLSDLSFEGSPPFCFTPEVLKLPKLRDGRFSPISGTVFPLEDTHSPSQPTSLQPKAIYEQQCHEVCDAIGGHPDQLAGLNVKETDKSNKLSGKDARENHDNSLKASKDHEHQGSLSTHPGLIPEDPFLLSSPYESTSVTEDLSSMRFGGRSCDLDLSGNLRSSDQLPNPPVNENSTESRMAWREFLFESKSLLRRRREYPGSKPPEYPTLKALREGLSKHRLNMKGLLHRSEEQPNQPPQDNHVRESVEFENARCSSDNNTLKEISLSTHQDSTVRLIPPSSPKDSFDLKEKTSKPEPAMRTPRSTPRSSLDIPSVDALKYEEKVSTEFALDATGFHPVKWSKAPAAQSWHNESLSSRTCENGTRHQNIDNPLRTVSHMGEGSCESGGSVSRTRVFGRLSSLNSVLSETTSVDEDDYYDDRSLVNAIMGRTRDGSRLVD